MDKRIKIVFMGTPDFAATVLNFLHNWQGCELVAAYCQPDRPAGRGKNLQCPAVKVVAQHFNIPVYQPLNFRDQSDIDTLAMLEPDVLVVAAYGLLLPQSVLDIPTIAPINVHASLLPLYRGAAPIQRAIMDGCLESGVSIMKMEAGLDTGPVYAMKRTDISNHTGGSLHDELADLGSKLLVDVLSSLHKKNLKAIPQDDSKATYAAKLSKADGLIFWNNTAFEIDAHIRGVTPWPGAHTSILRSDNEVLNIRIASGRIGHSKAFYGDILGIDPIFFEPGQLYCLEKNVYGICTEDHFYILDKVRPMNKSEMSMSDFARGYLLNNSKSDVGPLAWAKVDH